MESRERSQDRFDLKVGKNPRIKPSSRRRRVFLVDRHVLTRSAEAGWINRCSGLQVCGTAGGMAQAFRAVKRLRPDVVVTEIMRPHDLGFIRELHRRHPRLPILVFSMQDEAVYGARARAVGACGYLTKEAKLGELARSIRAALREGGRSARRNRRSVFYENRNPSGLGRAEGLQPGHGRPTARQGRFPVRKLGRHFAEAVQPPAERL